LECQWRGSFQKKKSGSEAEELLEAGQELFNRVQGDVAALGVGTANND
jgi:hypothetical protein